MSFPADDYPALPKTILLISTKSYFTPTRTIKYLESILDLHSGIIAPLLLHKTEVLFGLIPDLLTTYPCSEILRRPANTVQIQNPRTKKMEKSFKINLGAQDCSTVTKYGAYTGSVVAPALKFLGVSIIELGHAERRRPPISESDELIAAKAQAVCAQRMVPLVCIGEGDKPDLSGPLSMAVGAAMRQISTQIISVLSAIPLDAPVILAYEPVWAIGASEPAGVDYVGPIVQTIRGVVNTVQGRTGITRVVYGGSAGPGLWSGQKNRGNGLGRWVDGMFLGRFAHEISGVKEVVDEVLESLKEGEMPTA